MRPAWSRSTPRPPASTRCRRICAASRSALRRTKPATCRSAIAKEGRTASDLFAPEAKLCPTRFRKATRCAVLKPLLEDKGVLKVAQNMKYDWLVFAQRGIEIAGYDDTMLISYVLDAGKGGHGMDDLAKRWLNHDTIHFHHVAGRAKRRSPSTASPSTRPPNTPPRTPTSRCGCGTRSSRGSPPSASPPSTRRWSAPCRPCWRAWSGAAFPSTARCCRACPANSRRNRARSRTKSSSSPASRSIPARPSSSATSCSAR